MTDEKHNLSKTFVYFILITLLPEANQVNKWHQSEAKGNFGKNFLKD